MAFEIAFFLLFFNFDLQKSSNSPFQASLEEATLGNSTATPREGEASGDGLPKTCLVVITHVV